jgi:hypothetical protein
MRVAPCRRLDQPAKVIEQRAILDRKPLAPAAWPAHPAACHSRAVAQFRQASANRAASQAGDPRHHRHTPAACRQCLRRREPPTAALVQHRIERLVAQSHRRLVTHPTIL